jgi:hypothetical protein
MIDPIVRGERQDRVSPPDLHVTLVTSRRPSRLPELPFGLPLGTRRSATATGPPARDSDRLGPS